MWNRFDREMKKLGTNYFAPLNKVNLKRFSYSLDIEIEKVIFNNPATIVFFKDGEKIVVKANNEDFDKEKGLAMAVIRRLYSRNEFKRMIENAINQEEKIEKDYEFEVGDKVRVVKNVPYNPKTARDTGKVFTIEAIHSHEIYPYLLAETNWARKKEELELVEKGE